MSGSSFVLWVVLEHPVDRLIERHQQRHMARDDLSQDALAGADLRFAAFIG